MSKRGLATHLVEFVRNPAAKSGEMLNYALATKPRFVIIGTGRSGTTFTADYLSKADVPVSHEAYFTFEGPKLRTTLRDYRTQGDSSWCAVPFLPDPDIIAIHQVRHPYKVIGSFYNTGFFDPKHHEGRQGFVNFAKRYFEFSDDPLRSCLRWYLEWNAKCEEITSRRFQIEMFDEHIGDICNWLGIEAGRSVTQGNVNTNARQPRVEAPISNIRDKLGELEEFELLKDMADRYGYEL